MRIVPAYFSTLLLLASAVDHSDGLPAALKRNHDTLFAYCPTTLPLNFVFLNNLAGLAGCGIVSNRTVVCIACMH